MPSHARAVPPAIPYPDAAALERNRQARIRIDLAEALRKAQQQLDRQPELLRSATSDGYARGYRRGYIEGLTRGLWVGALAGVLGAGVVTLVVVKAAAWLA